MDLASRAGYILVIILVTTGMVSAGSGQNSTWTNENTCTVTNHPERQTIVTFSECVKILSITTNHWNYGNGAAPGSISLFNEDGTMYGPWGTAGMNGSDGVMNAYWISRPGEEIKAGSYRIIDTSPETWAQNDESDNRGMVTIIAEPALCDGEGKENVTPSTDGLHQNDMMKDGITLQSGDIDPATLTGGAADNETVPVITQVAFTPVTRKVSGGDRVYAILRVKNTGDRDLKDGYISVRFTGTGGTSRYRGGMAKMPLITIGEERDIPLVISTEKPEIDTNGTGFVNEAVVCIPYRIEGSISELMKGGYFQSRGKIGTAREDVIEFAGCCREPFTGTSVRAC